MAKDALIGLMFFVLGYVLLKIDQKVRELLDKYEREIYEWYKGCDELGQD